ncbi:glycosyltransferase [Rhodococcus sp. LW-XY12]|uniref:glycosyltransferase n=1 Tax=Rhodococcus sp. LW-XY12 TaxID=2856851 RepID=UPI001C56F2B7|nr:glycosyltransferase [Rhodococcus sp. LW-XY12]QXU53012.1 glycosyltransferase [Rhodococcus sp. LW-XY12]
MTISMLAFPMHGQRKLVLEGYRTRDGHLIEWFGKKLAGQGHVGVISRPEPRFLQPRGRYSATEIAENTVDYSRFVWSVPDPRDRRRWWVKSSAKYRVPACSGDTPAIAWNPFAIMSDDVRTLVSRSGRMCFDLLDDWTVHYAFEGIRSEVVEAYRRMFDAASVVTANSEATLELAHRFGRDDAHLLLNGCDPERFSAEVYAEGPTTVGYVGKIGKRLDLNLILSAARELSNVRFVFAGPILDREYRDPMKKMDNIELLGDVHYRDVPELLTKFDVGWVPHRTGEGEVGGDVIKTYEYRAAQLVVLSTPVLGSGRGLEHVHYLPAGKHIDWLKQVFENGPRVPRRVGALPSDISWSSKADFILDRLA